MSPLEKSGALSIASDTKMVGIHWEFSALTSQLLGDGAPLITPEMTMTICPIWAVVVDTGGCSSTTTGWWLGPLKKY